MDNEQDKKFKKIGEKRMGVEPNAGEELDPGEILAKTFYTLFEKSKQELICFPKEKADELIDKEKAQQEFMELYEAARIASRKRNIPEFIKLDKVLFKMKNSILYKND